MHVKGVCTAANHLPGLMPRKTSRIRMHRLKVVVCGGEITTAVEGHDFHLRIIIRRKSVKEFSPPSGTLKTERQQQCALDEIELTEPAAVLQGRCSGGITFHRRSLFVLMEEIVPEEG
jgi:hypothetical protein